MKEKRIYFLFMAIWFGFFEIFPILSRADEVEKAANADKEIKIEVYVYNVCASCDPFEEFYKTFQEELGDIKKDYSYQIYEYNTFHAEGKARFQEICERYKLSAEECSLPAVRVGEKLLCGQDRIQEGLREAFLLAYQLSDENSESEEKKEYAVEEEKDVNAEWRALEEELSSVPKEASFFLLFTTYSCRSCEEVKAFFRDFPEKVVIGRGEEGTQTSPVFIREISILEDNGNQYLLELLKRYDVPEKEQQVPILFYAGGYLSGEKEIKNTALEVMMRGEALGFIWDDKEDKIEEKSGILIGNGIGLILAGFINGLNPCGISMLLMLLSITAVSGKREVKRVGFSYLLGKYIAYLGMGMGIYRLFLFTSQTFFLSLKNIMSGIFGILSFFLAGCYLLDFIHVRRMEYGKVRMQLPQKLRHLNHQLIKKAEKIPIKSRLIGICLLGALLSAGEFFCTGQIYLTAILYMMKTSAVWDVKVLFTFVSYVTALCAPSALFVLVIARTQDVVFASDFAMKHMALIKLLSAAVFTIFGISLLV